MSRAILIVLCVFFAVVYSAQLDNKCGLNKIYTECGSACPPTCKDPNPKLCTLQCLIGCECEPGFYSNEEENCVTLAECDQGTTSIPTTDSTTDENA